MKFNGNLRRQITATTAILMAGALGLVGCGGGETAGYDQAFRDGLDASAGETVTISATVNDDITPTFFSNAGTEDTDVEPLLVMHAEDTAIIQDGLKVKVTGTVREALDIAALEEEMGADLNESALGAWNGEPYLDAAEINVLEDN